MNQPLWLRWIDKLATGFGFAAAASVALMLVHIVLDVGGRFLFRQPITGTLEYVQWIWMPMIVFLAFGLAQVKDEHINATVLTDTLSARARRVVDIIALSCAVVGTAVLIYPAILNAQRAVEINDTALSAAFVPRWPVKILVVACLVVLLLAFIASLARRIANIAPDRSLAAEEEIGEAL